ncbi:MAG: CRISPR-associated endonuclease Cas1 [Syntrophorhabdaceae bacterium]|nr:CRISPR-associated endonuclease Cas1 [Syntrophorhabdaceae bacterium]
MDSLDRTLYLNEKKGLEVSRDGPSLWIKEDGKSGRRIPVRLISHVVIVGNVRLDAGSITLFTENNIPVTFMNKRGDEIAVTIPYNHKLNSHYEEQQSILRHEERIEKFRQWLVSERRKMQLKVVYKLSKNVAKVFSTKGFREQDYIDFIKRYVSVPEKQWRPVHSIIAGMLREMVLKSIMTSELDPHCGIIHRRDNFGMVLDLFYATEPECDLQTIQLFKSQKKDELLIQSSTGWVLTREGMRNVVERFENKKKLIHRLLENIMDSLFETIRLIRIKPITRVKIY